MRRFRPRAYLLLAVGLGAFMVSWSQTTPPRGYPDETDHLSRAYAVGEGQFYGRPNRFLDDPRFASPPEKVCCVPGNVSNVYWVALGVRFVDVPEWMLPKHLPCPPGKGVPPEPCDVPDGGSGDVEVPTSMGTIEPGLYLLPGAAAHAAKSPEGALRLGRLVNALLCAALLLLAVLALSGVAGEAAILGLVIAASPTVLFFAGSISPSAVEISAGIAFFAVLLRLARDAAPARWLWIAAAVTGVALALSRSLGPVWIAMDILVVGCLVGPRAVAARLRQSVAAAAAAVAAVGLAVLSTVVWEATRQPGIPFDFRFFLGRLRPSIKDYDRIGEELIAKFGSINIGMPWPGYVAWAGLLVSLLVVAFFVGTNRERVVLAAVVATCLAIPAVLPAATLNQNGFALQGRHVLAAVVTMPLLAGEIVYRNRRSLSPRLLGVGALCVMVAASAVHLVAFLTAGRDYGWLGATGSGGALPPGGRTPWIVVAVLGTLMILLGGLFGRDPDPVELSTSGDDRALAEHR